MYIITAMSDIACLYIENLRDGSKEKIDWILPAQWLDVQDESLAFTDFVTIAGEAYLAGEELVIHVTIIAYALIPCSVCNKPVKVEVRVNNFYHVEPLAEMRSGIFDCDSVIREAVLVETPAFAECNQGNCTERRNIKKYLKKDDDKRTSEEMYYPFKDL